MRGACKLFADLMFTPEYDFFGAFFGVLVVFFFVFGVFM